MWTQAHGVHFLLALVINVGGEQLFGEDVALEQELMVAFEGLEGFIERVEFSPPDPSCNPYMAFAAMVMAGLDGVENKIDPGQPLDKDIYDLGTEELAKVPSMPGALDEALEATLASSSVP